MFSFFPFILYSLQKIYITLYLITINAHIQWFCAYVTQTISSFSFYIHTVCCSFSNVKIYVALLMDIIVPSSPTSVCSPHSLPLFFLRPWTLHICSSTLPEKGDDKSTVKREVGGDWGSDSAQFGGLGGESVWCREKSCLLQSLEGKCFPHHPLDGWTTIEAVCVCVCVCLLCALFSFYDCIHSSLSIIFFLPTCQKKSFETYSANLS